MTKSKNKILFVLIGTGALLVLLSVAARFLLVPGRTYELNLPDYQEVYSATLTKRSGEETGVSAAFAQDILFILKGDGRSTRQESVQDAPVGVDDWVRVDFSLLGGKTAPGSLFLYQKPEARDGEYFVEQPYNGIYSLSKDDYDHLLDYCGVRES